MTALPKYTLEQAAKRFLAEYPIGALLKPEEFDEWARKHGLLNSPPPDVPRNSDIWLAHLQRRHQFRYHLNRVAMRPLVGNEEDRTPFVIEMAGGGTGLLEVRTPAMAVSKNRIATRVSSLVVTKRRQLQQLLKSADWTALPPYEKIFAETLYRSIDRFAKRTLDDSNELNEQFQELAAKLRAAIEIGAVKSMNHGIAGILDAPQTDEEPEPDGEPGG